MALIACSECQTKISNKATLCPKCGFPIAKKSGFLKWGFGFIFLLIFIGVLGFIFSTPEQRAKSAKSQAADDICEKMMSDSSPGSERRMTRQMCDQLKTEIKTSPLSTENTLTKNAFPMEVFIVPLADIGSQNVAQIGVVFELENLDRRSEFKSEQAIIRGNILTLLSRKTSKELLAPGGKETLSKEILEQTNKQFELGDNKKKIAENVVFSSFEIL